MLLNYKHMKPHLCDGITVHIWGGFNCHPNTDTVPSLKGALLL